MMMLLLGIVLAAIIFYYYVVKPMKYWKERGVEYGKPKWIFGHFWENFIGRKNFVDIVEEVYNQSPNARYTGMYNFSKPVLIPRDPDLIKMMAIKDFDAFTDHAEIVPSEQNPLWAKNLLNMKGSQWKDMRNYLSPSFTSSKMRGMFNLMAECAEDLIQYLQNKKEKVISVEMRDLFSRYTNDVIATTAFGLKVNSFEEPNNVFYQMGNDASDLSGFKKVSRILLYWCFSPIKYILNVKLIGDEARDYFRGIMNHAIKTREEKNIRRPDMLHLLLEARKNLQKQKENGSEKILDLDLTDEDITAQAVIFITAGFESVSSFICFSTYELAVNPEIQEKLRTEIQETLEKCEGKLTYESILNMKYLDMVLSETLRKWPHFTGTDRICTRPYTIEPVQPGEKPVHLEKGDELFLPIYGIHRDPKRFPDPERFDPERFSDENKGNIHPYSYIPFGLGPRNCIGSRFALLEAKILMVWLLSKFEIVPVEKTQIPLKFSKETLINLKPEGGFWCGFKPCNKQVINQ